MRRYSRPFVVGLIVCAAALSSAQGQQSQSLLRSSPQMLAVLSEVAAKASAYTVRVKSGDKDVALGTIVRPDGWILTKASELKTDADCVLKDGRTFEAQLVGVNKKFDLAMLKIDAKDLPVADWRPSTDAEVGSWIITPGLGKEPLAVGVLSVAKRDIPQDNRPTPNMKSGFLGVEMAQEENGVRVAVVRPDTAADKAGILENDIIVGLDATEVKDSAGMLEFLGKTKPGDEVTVHLLRDGKKMALKVKLGRRAPESGLNRGAMQNSMGSMLSNLRTGFPVILQHDTVLKPSECGGPAVDLDGKAIGVNIARAGRTESYAIPSEVVETLLPDLIAGKLPPETPFKKKPTLSEKLKLAEDARTNAMVAKEAAERRFAEADAALKKIKEELAAEKKKEDEKKKDSDAKPAKK